jgi:hypothetical protein
VCRRLALVLCACVTAASAFAEPPVRDPMQPFVAVAGEPSGGTSATPAPRFRLTAVLIAPSRRVAIVNGRPYQEGQRVDGAEIVSIEAHDVRLRDGKAELILHLGGGLAGAHAGGDSAK